MLTARLHQVITRGWVGIGRRCAYATGPADVGCCGSKMTTVGMTGICEGSAHSGHKRRAVKPDKKLKGWPSTHATPCRSCCICACMPCIWWPAHGVAARLQRAETRYEHRPVGLPTATFRFLPGRKACARPAWSGAFARSCRENGPSKGAKQAPWREPSKHRPSAFRHEKPPLSSSRRSRLATSRSL